MSGLMLRLRKSVAPGMAPVFTSAPIMSMAGADLDVGVTVSCDGGTVTGASIIDYQWEVGGAPLYASLGVLAQDETFVIPKGIQWEVPRCKVTATNAHGSTVAYSNDLGRVTIDFGAKTFCQHGEKPLGLGAVTIASGANMADFTMSGGSILPSGTANAAKTWAASRYALTLSDGTVVKLRIADGFTWAATAADTYNSNQLRYVLGRTGATAPKLGDNIWSRDGYWNPTSPVAPVWGLDIPAAGYSAGTGERVVVRSERVDYALDTNGNPRNMHGTRFGYIAPYYGAVIDAKVDFEHVWLYANVATPRAALFQRGGGSIGWGMGFIDSRVECGPSVTNPDAMFGLRLEGGDTVRGTTFTNVGTGVYGVGNKSRGFLTGERNVFFKLYEDAAKFSGSGIQWFDNIAFDEVFKLDNHADAMQHLGATGGATDDEIYFEGNLTFRNDGVLNKYDFQHIFLVDTVEGSFITPTVRHNFAYVTSAHGVWTEWAKDPLVEFNTTLADMSANHDTISAVIIKSIKAGVGGVWNRNVSNTFDVSSQTGTVVNTRNLTVPKTLVASRTAYPNLPAAAGTSMCNRAAMLLAATPANLLVAAGGVVDPDGTVSGFLFPAAPGQPWGARNDGSVFLPLDPDWVAAHPPSV